MRPVVFLLALSLLGQGCAPPSEPDLPDPPFVPAPESCEPVDLDDVTRFTPCTTGGGVFGAWALDERGLPAYDYGLDQNADARARFFNTEGLDRRDHWAPFGNARLNALAFNDGYVEVVTQDRGVSYLNKFDEARRNFAGGFSWLDDGEETWSTAYKWRPANARTSRRFGMGYAEASTRYRGVELRRRTFSPHGNHPVVIDEVTLVNHSRRQKTLKHYEYWDVARRSIEINWLASGIPFASVPAEAAAKRDARNSMFDEAVSFAPEEGLLLLRRAHAADVQAPPRSKPDPVDYYPADPFLASLVGEASDLYVDQNPFFGEGGVAAPAAVVARAPGEGLGPGAKGRKAKGTGQARMFVMRTDLTLAPGEQRTLRFAYGYAPMGEAVQLDPHWRDPAADLLKESTDALAPSLMYFASDKNPELHRELAWHAYQVEASVGYREYWGQNFVPQGSAYLYLHGADGAARDIGLFALPLVYTHPELARDELLLYMKLTHAEGRRFSYAFQGHGMLDDALGFHGKPSDLPLFFLLALVEYVGATGDLAVLDQKVPFYPVEAEPDARGWDHVVGAVRHLFDVVGTGPHGLVRLQTGDWSDGIVSEAPNRDLAVKDGESVPNTQLALAVLPQVAELVEGRDPALAAEIRKKLPGYCEAVKKTWTGTHFGRAYFGDGKLVYAKGINLEAQIWALLSDCFVSPSDREVLIEQIRTRLDEPSPTGATILERGEVWPAISGVLTWSYARTKPELAWAHFARNTMAAHAVAFPQVWYGIWSGPDGLKDAAGDRPGETWHSPVTPMTDFPVMNNNQHVMPLFAAIRMSGVEPTASGLVIRPHVPSRHLSLKTRLLELTQRPGRLELVYRKVGAGPRVVEIFPPEGEALAAATQDGQPVAVRSTDASVRFTVTGPAVLEIRTTTR